MRNLFCWALILTAFILFSIKAFAGPIHDAAKQGDIKKVTELLNQGADVNAKDEDGITPLHEAALTGETNAARLLIEKGADMNAKTNYGETPMDIARRKGNTEIVSMFEKFNERQKKPVEVAKAKIRDAFEAGFINIKQLNKANEELNTGKRSKTINAFLEGKLDAKSFGELYY